jgi:hypothetical protein
MRSAPPPSAEALEYREIQSEIQKQQADLALTGVKIENESRGLVEGLKELEKDMVSTPEAGTIWLSQVQALGNRAEELRREAENLNIQLGAERETNGMLNVKFNAYEAAQDRAISERDTEIAALKVENGTVKGQRNTLLAIVITAGVVVAAGIIVSVLRRLKIIPI